MDHALDDRLQQLPGLGAAGQPANPAAGGQSGEKAASAAAHQTMHGWEAADAGGSLRIAGRTTGTKRQVSSY